MKREGQTLIKWAVGMTAFVGALLLVITAFQGGLPETFQNVIGGGLGIWGGENLTWNTLSVYRQAGTGMAEEPRNYALLSFDEPLADDVVQGDVTPIRVTSPAGVSVQEGYHGSEYGLSDHLVAFTLAGDIASGEEVTVEVTGTITSQRSLVLTGGECTDEFDDATAGEDVNASRCDESGEGWSGSGPDASITFTRSPGEHACTSETYDIAASVSADDSGLDGSFAILTRASGEDFVTLTSTICSGDRCTVSGEWSPGRTGAYYIKAQTELGDGTTVETTESYTVEDSCPPIEWDSLRIVESTTGGASATLTFSRQVDPDSVSTSDFMLLGQEPDSAVATDDSISITSSTPLAPDDGSPLTVDITGEIAANGGETLSDESCTDDFNTGGASSCN